MYFYFKCTNQEGRPKATSHLIEAERAPGYQVCRKIASGQFISEKPFTLR